MLSMNDDGRPGFHMTFANGWTASVQWGRGMCCESRETGANKSASAEIACWPKGGEMQRFDDGDTVAGWVPADKVARFLSYVADIRPETVPAAIDLDAL